MKRGTLIVLDGADGCGKATQTRELVKRLMAEGYTVQTMDFPQYENNLFGSIIDKCQRDPALDFSKKDPYVVSILYAGDRYESKRKLESWLSSGAIVVLDRYVSANQLHQGGKIKDPAERKIFLQYLEEMEYGLFKIPRPDKIIYLDLPHDISLQLMIDKGTKEKSKYNDGEMDMVEQDAQYQLGARESGIAMLEDSSWSMVECSLDGKTIRTIEDIHEEIFQIVLAALK